MPPYLSDIIEFGGWFAASGIVLGIVWWFFGGIEKSEKSRKKIQSWLNHDTVGEAYRGLLRGALDRLDRALCTDEELALPATHRARAWSHNLLSLTLAVAFSYPILSLAVRWTFSNSAEVGGAEVLAPERRTWLRYVTMGLIFGAVGLLLTSDRSSRLRGLGLAIIAGSIILGLMFLSFWLGTAAVGVVFPVGNTVAVTMSILMAFARSGSFPSSAAGAFVGVLACLYANAPVFTVARAAAITSAALLVPLLGRLSGRPTFVLSIWYVLSLAIVAYQIRLLAGTLPGERGILAFLSLLPLINGLCDFASIGLTRWSLRRGVEGLLPWSALIDLIGAALIFVFLGSFCIWFIDTFRPQDGVPLIDLNILFQELSDPVTRGQYWWLLFTLFSTLIPTVIHFSIAAVAFFTVYPEWMRVRIAAWLKDAPEDQIAARGGRLALSCAVTAAIMIPTIFIVETFRQWPSILGWTIWIFESFARAIGAIP